MKSNNPYNNNIINEELANINNNSAELEAAVSALIKPQKQKRIVMKSETSSFAIN